MPPCVIWGCFNHHKDSKRMLHSPTEKISVTTCVHGCISSIAWIFNGDCKNLRGKFVNIPFVNVTVRGAVRVFPLESYNTAHAGPGSL